MLRSNLHQLLCIGFCGFFSNFACQMSSLLEEIPWALAICGGRELAGMSLVLYLFKYQPGAGVTRCQVPASPRAPGCTREILNFTFFSSAASPTAAPHAAAGRAPSCGQCYLRLHPASCGDTKQLHHVLRQVQTFPCSSVTCHVLQIRHHLL